MRPANKGWRYIVTSSLIGWVHTQMTPAYYDKEHTARIVGTISWGWHTNKKLWMSEATLWKPQASEHMIVKPCMHYPKSIGTVANWILVNNYEWNFNQNSHVFSQEREFWYVVCKMAAILTWLKVLHFWTSYRKFHKTMRPQYLPNFRMMRTLWS